MASSAESVVNDSLRPLESRYRRVRRHTVELTKTLEPEDTVVQSMPDVSPTKWHLAHVTWFFERFILENKAKNYARYDDAFDYLFNSYYYTAGEMHARPQRGMLSRPTLAQVLAYRDYVDEAMQSLIAGSPEDGELGMLVTLGLNHEQQHQELLLTDIKHVLSTNPMHPAFDAGLPLPETANDDAPHGMGWIPAEAGIVQIGADASDAEFVFDNETPRHDTLLAEHAIADRLVTNAEYRMFIDDGGYEEPALWLSDGWSVINERGWDRPLYWAEDLKREFTLGGLREIDPHAPVTHVSFYEADAYARWAGCRLPTEAEWEHAAAKERVQGNLFESGFLHPVAARSGNRQFFGDVWEWTASAYAAYPGFEPLDGSLGEYNGKFMCNQMTVRGGACVTRADHVRASYRSFFYPDARWQFLGIRLAKDGGS